MISKEFETSQTTLYKFQMKEIQNFFQHDQVWRYKQVHPESRPQDAKRNLQNT